MAAIFPIPYELETGDSYRPGRRTVIPFDPTRGGRRRSGPSRREIRRRNVGLVLAATVLFLVTVLGTGTVFAVVDSLSQPPSAATVTPRTPSVSQSISRSDAGAVIVVQPGDTLTSIAQQLQPTGDITHLVDRLAKLHGPAPLLAGERLAVGSLSADSPSQN